MLLRGHSSVLYGGTPSGDQVSAEPGRAETDRYKKGSEEVPDDWKDQVENAGREPVPGVSDGASERDEGDTRPSFRAPRGDRDDASPRGQEDARERRIIVKFEEESSPAARANARAAARVEQARTLPLIDAEVVVAREGADPEAVAARLERDPNVDYGEVNHVYQPAANPPDDPRFDELWGLHNTGQTIEGWPGTPGVDVGALGGVGHHPG
jgi:hypothetical protein